MVKITSPSILAVHLRDDGVMDGCNHYRFRIPFEEIRKRVDGSILDWAPMKTVREWASNPELQIKPTFYDMVMLPRSRPLPYNTVPESKMPEEMYDLTERELGVSLERRSHLLDLVRVLKTGQVVFLEYDDDYFTGSRDLGYEYSELLHELLGEVHAVTVSTPYLRDLIHKISPGTSVFVLPNSVNFGEWQNWESKKGELFEDEDMLVIGLTGSKTHVHDWEVLSGVIDRIMDEYRVGFFMAGFTPDYLTHLKDVHPGRVYEQTGVPYEQYPGLIRMCDIILCPVEPDDGFNWSKSAIKAVEGMASGRPVGNKVGGAAVIASPLDYYDRVLGRTKRGITLTEHTPEAWYRAIRELIENRALRENYQVKGRRWVYQNRAIENQWPVWWKAFQEIYRRNK